MERYRSSQHHLRHFLEIAVMSAGTVERISLHSEIMRLAEKLHELKSARGLTQRKVAKAVGVSHTTVNRWFNGTGAPSVYEAARLAEFFGVPVGYLADDPMPTPELRPPTRPARKGRDVV
jgi:DNA-binding XRE family transcriptional regulator